MGQDDGIYVSTRQRRRRRRKIGTAAAGVALALGAGAYAMTTWAMGRESTVSGIAPIVTTEPTPPATPEVAPAEGPPEPASAPPPATMSAQRHSSRPSPVPSPSGRTDDELAAAQVSELLEPRPAEPGVAVAADAATVRNERTPDGTQVRVVSAHYDLTGRWRLLRAADGGQMIGGTRCTQNFKIDGEQAQRQNRPGLLLCWRTTTGKSVVAVATNSVTGHPTIAASVAVVDREWASLG
jgi:hypothetical protein